MSRRVLVLLLVGAIIPGLAGCGAPVAQAKYRIAVIPKGTTHDFWRSIHAGAVAAAREHGGVRILWEGPTKEDQRGEQQQIVERFVSEGVDAIVLAPTDRQTLVQPVKAALRKGIPVVIIDSGIDLDAEAANSASYLGYIATDNKQGGVEAGKRMLELVRDKPGAKVMLLRYQKGSESTEQREAGFREAVQGGGKLNYLEATDEAGATVDSAQKVAERLFADNKDLDGLFAPNESSATGVLRSLELLRRSGTVKIVGFDASDYLIRCLEDGKAQGLVLQDPFGMGSEGVKRALAYLEKRPITGGKTLHTALKVATKENMRDPDIAALYARDLKPYLSGE